MLTKTLQIKLLHAESLQTALESKKKIFGDKVIWLCRAQGGGYRDAGFLHCVPWLCIRKKIVGWLHDFKNRCQEKHCCLAPWIQTLHIPDFNLAFLQWIREIKKRVLFFCVSAFASYEPVRWYLIRLIEGGSVNRYEKAKSKVDGKTLKSVSADTLKHH